MKCLILLLFSAAVGSFMCVNAAPGLRIYDKQKLENLAPARTLSDDHLVYVDGELHSFTDDITDNDITNNDNTDNDITNNDVTNNDIASDDSINEINETDDEINTLAREKRSPDYKRNEHSNHKKHNEYHRSSSHGRHHNNKKVRQSLKKYMKNNRRGNGKVKPKGKFKKFGQISNMIANGVGIATDIASLFTGSGQGGGQQQVPVYIPMPAPQPQPAPPAPQGRRHHSHK